jgi:hypothetical protein
VNAKHLSEEILEAHVPHWTVLIQGPDGMFYEVGAIDFKPTSDQGGLVILQTSPPLKEVEST